jgi:isoquinoline 1-oxidoreductase alpha subunit
MDITINGQTRALDLDANMPLLWALRDELNLTGTKFGCGVGSCGACTVEVDGMPLRSCVLPLSAVEGKSVRTIEAPPDRVVSALQSAWLADQVPQCGYCQSGMIIAAAGLLRQTPQPSDADIDRSMTNICRCGTYQRVRAAIHKAAAQLAAAPGAGA